MTVSVIPIVSGPVQAQELDPVTQADLECAAWSALVSEQVEGEKAKLGLQMGLTYFVGKAMARQPDLDIETNLNAQLIETMIANIDANNERCGSELKIVGDALQRIGRAAQGKQEDALADVAE